MAATFRAVLLRPGGVQDHQDVPAAGEGLPFAPQFVFFENRLFERTVWSDQHDADGRIYAYTHRNYVHPIRN